MSESPWLSLAQAAEYCGSEMAQETVRRAVVAGECVGFQLTKGGKWRVRREHLDAWLMGMPADLVAPRVARGRAS